MYKCKDQTELESECYNLLVLTRWVSLFNLHLQLKSPPASNGAPGRSSKKCLRSEVLQVSDSGTFTYINVCQLSFPTPDLKL